MQTIKSVARRRWAEDDRAPLQLVRAAPRPAMPWPAPCDYVLAGPQLFLNTSSDARLLPADARGGRRRRSPVPDRRELAADVAASTWRPLFDGAELERI